MEAGSGPEELPALTGAATPTMVVTTPKVKYSGFNLGPLSLAKLETLGEVAGTHFVEQRYIVFGAWACPARLVPLAGWREEERLHCARLRVMRSVKSSTLARRHRFL